MASLFYKLHQTRLKTTRFFKKTFDKFIYQNMIKNQNIKKFQFGACCCGRSHLLTELISLEKNSPDLGAVLVTEHAAADVHLGLELALALSAPGLELLHGHRSVPREHAPVHVPDPALATPAAGSPAREVARGRSHLLVGERVLAEPQSASSGDGGGRGAPRWLQVLENEHVRARRPCQPPGPWWTEGGARVVLLLLPDR
jgi:hypothetical protein